MSEAEPSPSDSGSQSPAEDAGNEGDGFGSGSSGDDAGLTAVPPQTGRFIVNSDGTVLDPAHELIWTQHATEPKTWVTARRYCTELKLASGGYHLSTLAELKTIQQMQFGWASAVHPNVFPNTPGNWFWTSTIAEKNSFDEDPSAGRLSFADTRGITEKRLITVDAIAGQRGDLGTNLHTLEGPSPELSPQSYTRSHKTAHRNAEPGDLARDGA